jgi:hypothetical protein
LQKKKARGRSKREQEKRKMNKRKGDRSART